jgi:hypothetical protein
MLNSAEFRLITLQAVIYTPDLKFSSANALGHLLGTHSGRLNGVPTALPISPDAPPEVPRLVLQSEDSSLRLQAAPSRLDVACAQETIPPEEVSKFIAFAVELFAGYVAAMKGEVKRVACVAHRFAPDEHGAMDVAKHFCKPELLQAEGGRQAPLNRPSDFEIHAAKQFDFGGGGWLKVNSWFRCKSANLKFGNKALAPGVLLEQDFNTVAVEQPDARLFEPGEIKRFFEEAPAELQKVVDLYFPSSGV